MKFCSDLARDGWLTIQHGKPTKVNNYWETCGLNILPTLAKLDIDRVGDLIDQILSARTNFSAIYARGAVKNNPEKVIELAQKALDFLMTHKSLLSLTITSTMNWLRLLITKFMCWC